MIPLLTNKLWTSHTAECNPFSYNYVDDDDEGDDNDKRRIII